MKKRRVLVLLHKDLIPPNTVPKGEKLENAEWRTEYYVVRTLKEVGHEVFVLGVVSDLVKIRETVESFKPHIVFNLLEEFDGEAIFDQNVVSYLELLGVPYTGCNPRGLMLSRDKALAKKILSYHRIRTPKFCVFPRNKKKKLPQSLKLPLIVKCLDEEASMGISQASVVHSEEKLYERIRFIHRTFGVDAIAEQFIEGRELYVGILGNYKLKTLPIWALQFSHSENEEKEIYSSSAKFNEGYRKRKGVRTGVAKVDDSLKKQILEICKRTYRVLCLSGYARIDLRVDLEGRVYVIEANPNPDIAKDDEFALSAKSQGIEYLHLLEQVIQLGLRWSPKKKTDN